LRSGIDFDEDVDAGQLFFGPPNSGLLVLNKPMFYPPRILWSYNTGNSQVLAEIIRRATGKTPLEYAKQKIFDKIGIKTYLWKNDKSGTQYGGFGLSLRPRDLAKFGYLYLKKGKWGDVSVIPEEWVNESVKAHVKTVSPNGDYGYHCWIPRIGGFATRGRDGQIMYVFPEKELIVVFTADIPDKKGNETGSEDLIVSNYILSACP
jgi:CubicO group peptidase (beta-lactamase class C family)